MFDFTGGKRYKVSLYALVIIACITWGCTLFVGCRQKTTTTPTQFGYVTFSVQWDSLPKVDAPKDILRFCFYPADNGPMIQTDTDTGSLRIALAPGKYGLLVYNYGKNNFQLRNRTQFQQMGVAFKEGQDGHSKTPSIPVYGVVIPEFEVKANQDVTTAITPTFFTKQIYFRINIAREHQKHIHHCEGILSGVSPFMSIPNRTIERNTTTSLSLPFEKKESGFEGQTFLLDGAYNGSDQTSHKLTLHFTLHDGKTLTSTVDMESRLLDINQEDILVDIDALLNRVSEPEISLICKSIGIRPNI